MPGRLKRRFKRDPMIVDVIAGLARSEITIGPIHDGPNKIHGFVRARGSIRINPNIELCDTAIHECLHKLRPDWSESYVRARTCRMMQQLSIEEVDKIADIVNGVAYKTKKVKRIS